MVRAPQARVREAPLRERQTYRRAYGEAPRNKIEAAEKLHRKIQRVHGVISIKTLQHVTRALFSNAWKVRTLT
jgi:hypothetical protein